MLMISPAYAETIQELYESGTAPESIPCKNPDHHIALRDNGKLICATEMTLERLGLDAIQSAVVEAIRLAESPPICGESMAKVSEVGSGRGDSRRCGNSKQQLCSVLLQTDLGRRG